MKVFKNNADPTKKAETIQAFIRRMPRDPEFVGTDEEWVEEAMLRNFKDIVHSGKRLQSADTAQPQDLTSVV